MLESKPRWFRHFHLFDKGNKQIKSLNTLRKEVIVSAPKLDVQIKQGDSNVLLVELLDSRSISQKEATFCLLDQRTFECKWSTVQALAGYKTSGHKIELFYFLCNSWLDRALAAVKKREILTDWWGNEGWEKLRKFTGDQRAEHLSKRVS